MPDDRTIRRKVLLRLLGHPWVLAPGVLGFSAGTVLWALNLQPGLGSFAALAGLCGAVGGYLTRVILDDGRTARTVLAELAEAERAAAQTRLDDLDRRLVKADDDPRPETALRDLRALLGAFEQVAEQARDEHIPAVVDVRSRVQQLFDHSLRSLERTLGLYATARQLQLPEARRPLLDERERILADVQAGIRQLGTTLVALQQLGAGDRARGELARLRDELDDSLQVANRVEARLSALLEGSASAASEPPPRPVAEPNPKGN